MTISPSPQGEYAHQASMSFDQFNAALLQAQAQWSVRKAELSYLMDAKPLLLFGFGGKGQTLAHQLKEITRKPVTIFDSSIERRLLAQAMGYAAIDELTPETADRWAIVLGSGQAQLEQKHLVKRNYLFHQEAANLIQAPALENLYSDYEEFVIDYSHSLYQVFTRLHPDSQARFLAVLRFRLCGDPSLLLHHRQPLTEMWLDIPSEFSRREYRSFLDVGAYDGDTLRHFRERFQCVRGIAVEANPEWFGAIQSVAKNYPEGIEIMPVAAWSKKTKLRFEEVRFGMIQVTESPTGQLDAAPIDDFVKERIDVLKMDIEGAEGHALDGLKVLFHAHRPDLAVAAYHKPGDLVDLYHQINELGYTSDSFDWHFGHYSDCIDDSIFYVLSKSRNSH